MDERDRKFVDGIEQELGSNQGIAITLSDLDRLIAIIHELDAIYALGICAPPCPTCRGWGWVPVKVGEDDVITEPCPVCEDFDKMVVMRYDNCGYTRDW